jgi:3'-5' exonuclease
VTTTNTERGSTAANPTAFLILDSESVPDGKLLGKIKYPNESLSDDEAIQRAQDEARARSATGSDFLSVTFQYPVAVCTIQVGADYRFKQIGCLDAPDYRPREIVRRFWEGMEHENARRACLVTFNGRGFDLPLLELAAFRYGISCRHYFQSSRDRYRGSHLDLMEFFTNKGAYRVEGGLNLLTKILGKPGKMDVSGDKVYEMYKSGMVQQINDYCMFDTLDTYFVFLRSRVIMGLLGLDTEQELVRQAKAWLESRVDKMPALQQYLANWGDWEPWP